MSNRNLGSEGNWKTWLVCLAAAVVLISVSAPAAGAQGLEDEEDCEEGFWIGLSPDEVIKACTLVIQRGKPTADTWFSRGDAYSEKGQYDLAIPDFDRAIQLNPRDDAAFMYRAEAYDKKGNYDRAIEDIDKAIGLRTVARQLSTSYEFRGEIKNKKKDVDGALGDFTKAIDLDNKNAEAFTNRCAIRFDRGDYDAAIADCSQSITLEPKKAYPLAVRGAARLAQDDYARAVEDLDRAIALAPSYAWAIEKRADAKTFLKDYDAGIAGYSRLIELDAKKVQYYRERGDIKAKKKDWPGAIADYTKAVDLDPKYVMTYLYRASVRYRMGDLAGSQADEKLALNVDPTSASAWFDVAFVKAFVDGRYESSLAEYDRAIAMDSKTYSMFWERGLVYLGLARYEQALADFKKVKELAKNEAQNDLAQMSIWLAQSRLAGPVAAAAEAKAYLAGRSPASGAEFSFTTLRYLAGDLSEAQFIAAGENPSKGKHVGSAMFYAGMKHVAEGDATGAAPLFRRGIEQPNNSSGYTYFNAVLELDRIASASAKPPVPPSPLSSGNSRDDAWRLCNTAETPADAAIAACTTILNSGSESVKNTAAGLFRRGMAYVAKSEDDRALGDLAGSIALDGANAGALQGRATIYIRKKQFDLAIEDLSRALSTDPKSTGALTLRGAAYLGKSQNYQALADYNAALAIVPQAAGALYGRGVVKQRTGDATGGQADIDAAVRLDKNVASEQGRLGLAPGR